MADSGTSFDIDLAVKAEGVASSAELLDRFAEKLTAASAAAASASDAVKAGEKSYAQAEATYDRAAKALEKITIAADAQRGKMKAAMDAGDASSFWRAAAAAEKLSQKQQEATAAAASSKSALAAQAESLDRLKSSAQSAAEAEAKMTATLVAAKKAETEMKSAADAAAKAQAADATAKLKAADAAAKLRTTQAAVAAGSGKVNEIAEAFGKLGGPLGAAGQKAFGAAEGFKKFAGSLGTKGLFLGAAVGMVAVAAAILAVAGAAAIGLAKVTFSAIKLADKTHQLDALEKKFGDNVKKLFGGLKIDKFLSQLGTLVNLFDANTESGKAIKTVFESLFQPLVDGATAMIPKIERAFIQLEILIVRGLTAIKPYGSKIAFVAEAVVGLAAVTIGVLVVAFVALVAIVVGAVAAFVYLSDAIAKGLISAFNFLVAKFNEAKAFLQNFSLAEIGSKIITGLADGIRAGGAAVVSAVQDAASAAIKAAKAALGVHSPSKVFAEIGVNTGAGFQKGIEASSGGAQGALENMVSPDAALETAAGSAPAAKGATTTTSTSSASANLSGATFNFYGVEGAEDAEGRFVDALTRALEGGAAQLGSAVAA